MSLNVVGQGVVTRKRKGTSKQTNEPFFGLDVAIMGRTVELSLTGDQYGTAPPEGTEVRFQASEILTWDGKPRYQLLKLDAPKAA